MGFTIEVEKKRKDEEFDFGNLGMFHQECHSGKIKSSGIENGDLRLFCRRCGVTCAVTVEERGTVRIARTAVDGQKRKVFGYAGEDWTEDHISVIQKIETK